MIQKIINHIYRYPKNRIKTWRKFGGYFAYKNMLANEKKMQKAASKIIIKPPMVDLESLPICFLTGEKYWHQTVFCAYSLQKVCKHPIHFTFYDDGSLNQVPNIQQQIPNSRIVYISEIEQNLQKNLSKEKYPYLNKKRQEYKHIRKLTDIYSDENGHWKLVLDSDMLFWKEPIQIIHWLKKPEQPFYIVDCETAYGYSLNIMEKLSANTIQEKINVGAIGLCKNLVDFDKLELWAKTLEQKYGASYYLEQALSAMIIGNRECEIGNPKDYIVYPSQQQVENKEGVLHHYVDVSKKWYFKETWKKFENG